MVAVEKITNENFEDLIFQSENPVHGLNIFPPYVAKFEKVSYEQFKKDMLKLNANLTNEKIKGIYDNIQLPKRSTIGSAGYDFFLPFEVVLRENRGVVIPTGIRCKIRPDWMLKLYPRSGQGFKYGLSFYNTVPIIDSDYYNTENEGHIMLKLTIKEGYQTFEAGTKICQGIFEQYGITIDDEVSSVRTGGLGSTGEK